MGISLIHLFLSLALTASEDKLQSSDFNKTPVDAEIRSVSLPFAAGTDGSLQFLVETNLPANCFSLKPAAVRVSYERNVILFHIEATATQPRCLASDSRLSEVVTVGALPKGSYEVRNLKDLKIWGNLQIQDQVSYAQNQ